MTRTTILDATLKLVTLVPLAILVFYTDVPSWLRELQNDHFLGILVCALCLGSYGMFLNRKIISSYLENWNSSFGTGLVVLSSSVAAYFIGSVYFDKSFFHYESLILIILSYLLLRYDARLVRQLIPLLVMSGLAFLPLALLPYFDRLSSGLLALLVMLAIFVVFYARQTIRTLLAPVALSTMGLVSWLGIVPLYISYAMPAFLLMLAVPSRLRKSSGIAEVLSPTCLKHTPAARMEEYCALCGRRFQETNRVFRPNILGLVVMIIIVLSILAVEVPVLSLSGSTPYDSVYNYSGVTTSLFAKAPTGWLVNSSENLNMPGDVYASRVVYVPYFHPEVSNYTLIYALAPSVVSLGTGTGEDLIGWNITLHNAYTLGNVQGSVTAYQAGETIVMNFAGQTGVMFMNGSKFQSLILGESFTRVFHGTQLANASSLFEGDLSFLFGPIIVSLGTASTWTKFLNSEIITLNQLRPAIIAIITAAAIFWISYAIKISDYRIDKVLSRASVLTDADFSLFQRISIPERRDRTIYEIAGCLNEKERRRAEQDNFSALVSSLERLRVHGLIRPVLSERGAEILYSWRVLP